MAAASGGGGAMSDRAPLLGRISLSFSFFLTGSEVFADAGSVIRVKR